MSEDLYHPKMIQKILGHDQAQQTFLNLYKQSKMPHAWLITGPSGVGKASLAYLCAKYLLSGGQGGGGSLFGDDLDASIQIDPDSPVVSKIVAGSHPDLLCLEKEEGATEIKIDAARKVAPFLRLTAAEGGWRVVIIDGADLLNTNAQNAILKILEEPPSNVVMFLTADNAGRMLPTIRSRCRHMALHDLETDVLKKLLEPHVPDCSDKLLDLAEGSVGRALFYVNGNALEYLDAIDAFLEQRKQVDLAQMQEFVAQLKNDDAIALCQSLLLWRIAKQSRNQLEPWVGLWEKLSAWVAQVKRARLDARNGLLQSLLMVRG